jgi:coproporphyrinogen III oxidase-like Fe-S oxidoreductase
VSRTVQAPSPACGRGRDPRGAREGEGESRASAADPHPALSRSRESAAFAVASSEAKLRREQAGEGEYGFAVYIHWPFCKSKCPYCDFNSHVRDGIDQARWRAALLAELEHYARETSGRIVTSMFFGGGTPSLMEPATAAALIERVAALWAPARDIEITLEANPTSVEAERFREFRAAGVNRVSLGVQALDDAALKELGRLHSAAEALDAVAIARTVTADASSRGNPR